MKKLILALVVLSIGWFTIVKAGDPKSASEVITAVKSVPGKLKEGISNEISSTKEFQAKSWADVKFQWQGFKDKFLSN